MLNFCRIDLSHKSIVDEYYKAMGLDSSEHTFTNMYAWGAHGDIKLAEENGCLYILLHLHENVQDTEPDDREIMFAPLVKRMEDYKNAITRCESFMLENGMKPEFYALCGKLVEPFKELGYAVREDRDNFDYIYEGEQLRKLAGKKLHAKRNYINRFTAEHEYAYTRLFSSDAQECLSVYDEWNAHKDFQDGGTEEREAIKRIFGAFDELGVTAGGIRVGGKLCAFTIGERITQKSVLIHIEKASAEYPGAYALINRDFLCNEFPNAEFVNREEDMGLPGLRRAKLSYEPVRFIEKQIATLPRNCHAARIEPSNDKMVKRGR